MLKQEPESDRQVLPLSNRGWWLSCVLGMANQAILLGWYYLPNPKRMIGDEGYYFNLAKKIAAGSPAEHHPFWPPLYAEFTGGVFGIFGQHLWLVQGIQVCLLFVSAWLLRDVLWRWTGHSLFANLAAALLLLNPEMAAFAHYLWPEIPHLFFMVTALWIWVRWPDGPWAGALVGVILALALLTKLLLLPFLPVAFLGVLVLSKARRGMALRLGAVLICMLAVLAPSALSNKRHHGKWMVADSSLFNLWVGLNDTEPADYRNDIAGPTFQEWEASGETWADKTGVFQEKLDRLAEEKGWLTLMLRQFPRQYRRLFDPHGFMVTQMPGGARSAYAGEIGWLAKLWVGWSMVWHVLVLGLTAMGVALVRWRSPSFWWWMGLFLIYNLAVMWWVHVKTRYLLQMHPAMIPFAVLALISLRRGWASSVLVQNGRGKNSLQGSPSVSKAEVKLRWWLAGGLALAVWLLALWPR